MKKLVILTGMVLMVGLGTLIDSVDTRRQGWVQWNGAAAHGYGTSRRVARRTARRTSRRVSHRHGYGYGAAAVGVAAVTAIAIGTAVATLPSGCRKIVVNGVPYYSCSGTYYEPRGDTYIVVEAP